MSEILTAEEITFLVRLVRRVGDAAVTAAAIEPNEERLVRVEWIAGLKAKLNGMIAVSSTHPPHRSPSPHEIPANQHNEAA